MNNRQAIFSVIITIVSLVIGYYLNLYGSKKANQMFLDTLREELDIIDDHYDKILSQGALLDERTKQYLQERRHDLQTKLQMFNSAYSKRI